MSQRGVLVKREETDEERITSPRAAFFAGVRSIAPMILGIAPFAVMAGVAAVGAGLSTGTAIGVSWVIFAGASQLAVVDLISKGAPALVVIATALVINLRFCMYSASLAPHFRDTPAWWKRVMAYMLTDQAYVMTITNAERCEGERVRRWFYLGTAIPLWGLWQLGTIVGVLVGARVPESWSLDFTIPLIFIALLVPTIKDRGTLTSALVAGGVGLAAMGMPMKLGLMVAALSGMLAGLIAERGQR